MPLDLSIRLDRVLWGPKAHDEVTCKSKVSRVSSGLGCSLILIPGGKTAANSAVQEPAKVPGSKDGVRFGPKRAMSVREQRG